MRPHLFYAATEHDIPGASSASWMRARKGSTVARRTVREGSPRGLHPLLRVTAATEGKRTLQLTEETSQQLAIEAPGVAHGTLRVNLAYLERVRRRRALFHFLYERDQRARMARELLRRQVAGRAQRRRVIRVNKALVSFWGYPAVPAAGTKLCVPLRVLWFKKTIKKALRARLAPRTNQIGLMALLPKNTIMVLLPSSAAATAKAKAWVAQQLQTDSYTTNQSTGSRAARLSEIEKLAIDVADLEKQVRKRRARARTTPAAIFPTESPIPAAASSIWSTQARIAKNLRSTLRAGSPRRGARPAHVPRRSSTSPRRRRADDDDDDAFDEMQSGLDALREKRDKARQRNSRPKRRRSRPNSELAKCLETLERAAQRRSAARRGEDEGARPGRLRGRRPSATRSPFEV